MLQMRRCRLITCCLRTTCPTRRRDNFACQTPSFGTHAVLKTWKRSTKPLFRPTRGLRHEARDQDNSNFRDHRGELPLAQQAEVQGTRDQRGPSWPEATDNSERPQGQNEL